MWLTNGTDVSRSQSCCKQGAARVWGPLDDVVMGGVSESGFEVRQHGAEHGGSVGLFNGIVSSANNGGFASVGAHIHNHELTSCYS